MAFHLEDVQVLQLRTAEAVCETARKLNDLGGTESEREDKERRKQRIKDKILGGEMTPFRWSVGHVPSANLVRRVNGQHSSEVFLDLNAEQWAQVQFPVIVFWEDYYCDTKKDLATLFEQFDPNWSARNKEDLIGAHLAVHEGLRVDRWVANHTTAGLAWYRQKVHGQTAKPELQFELIHENHEVHRFLTWCQANLERAKDAEMFHRSVMAALYHTTVAGDEELFGFWKRVAGGKSQNDAESIEYKLADFLNMVRTCRVLEDWPAPIRRNLKPGKRGPSENDIFATCLRAFSAFLKGQKVGDIFTPSKNRSPAQLVAELCPPQAA